MHIINLLVGGNTGAAPTTAANSYITGIDSLADGELAVVNDQNMVLSAATVLTDDRVAIHGIRIVGRYGSGLVYSDFIKAGDIISVNPIAADAGNEQTTFIGYNGTSGSIDAIANNVYRLKVEFMQTGRTGQGMREFFDLFYKTGAAATQASIAFGIEPLLRKYFNDKVDDCAETAVITAATVTNTDRFANAATVVKGSKFVTLATNLNNTHGTAVAAGIGDYVRLGTAAGEIGAVALGSPLYKIVGITNTTTLELDRPVTGASGTYTAATAASWIPAATVEAAASGIKVTGLPLTHIPGKFPYQRIVMNISGTDFGGTSFSTTAMKLGNGRAEQIKDLEWFTHGNTGYRYRVDYMYDGFESRVTAGALYKQLAIAWASDSRAESIGGPGHNPKQLIIAVHNSVAAAHANNVILGILAAYTTIALTSIIAT